MGYAIVSGIHANLQAWLAVLQDIRTRGAQQIICLGNVSSYGPDPGEILESVLRNVDLFVTAGSDPTLSSLLDPVNRTQSDRLYLEGDGFICAPMNIYLADGHSHPSEESRIRTTLSLCPSPVLILGEKYTAGVQVCDEYGMYREYSALDLQIRPGCRYVINVGAVGSFSGTDFRACYGIYDSLSCTFNFHRVHYQITTVLSQTPSNHGERTSRNGEMPSYHRQGQVPTAQPFRGLPHQSQPIPRLPGQSQPLPGLPHQSQPIPRLPGQSQPLPGLPHQSQPIPRLPGQSQSLPGQHAAVVRQTGVQPALVRPIPKPEAVVNKERVGGRDKGERRSFARSETPKGDETPANSVPPTRPKPQSNNSMAVVACISLGVCAAIIMGVGYLIHLDGRPRPVRTVELTQPPQEPKTPDPSVLPANPQPLPSTIGSFQGMMPEDKCVLWLDGDDVGSVDRGPGDVVQRWRDKSGANNHAVSPPGVNGPRYAPGTINGRAVMRFSGDGWLRVPPNPSLVRGTGVTIVAVVQPWPGVDAQGVVFKRAGAGVDYGMLISDSRLSGTSGSGEFQARQTLASGSAHLVSVVYDMQRPESQRGALFCDGEFAGIGPAWGKAAAIGDDDSLLLGAADQKQGVYRGDFAEIMLFRTALSDTRRRLIEEKLALKWQIKAFKKGAALTTAPKPRNVPVYASQVLTSKTGEVGVPIDLDLGATEDIYLVVADGGDGSTDDWANWADARFYGPTGETYLSDLRWEEASCSWGQVRKGKNVDGETMVVAGRTFEHGLGTSSLSVIRYRVPPDQTRFKAIAGIDPSRLRPNKSPSLQFLLFLDPPEPKALQTVHQPLSPGNTLGALLLPERRLEVDEWKAIGPFAGAWVASYFAEGGSNNSAVLYAGFAKTKYPVEEIVDLDEVFKTVDAAGKPQELRWVSVKGDGKKPAEHPRFLEFPYQTGVTYFSTWIFVPGEQSPTASFTGYPQGRNATEPFGVDIRALLNGKAIEHNRLMTKEQSVLYPKEDQTILLKQGWNHVYVRVTSVSAGCRVGIQIKGIPDQLEGMQVSAAPPREVGHRFLPNGRPPESRPDSRKTPEFRVE